jgi:hypothetical protein
MRPRHAFTTLALLAPLLLTLHGCSGAENTNSAHPSPTGTPTPASTPVAKIDEIRSRMAEGSIAYNLPPSMRLHETQTITLLLSPKEASGRLAERIREEGAAGDIKEGTLKVAEQMQAVLSGDGFQIDPIPPDTVPISWEEPTQWRWDVRPLRGGDLVLHVTLYAIVNLDDGQGPRPYRLRTHSQPYTVHVPWGDGAVATFFKTNWKWLWLTMLVPGVALLWNRKRAKRRAAARWALFRGDGGGVFISYRRDDSAGHVGRLHQDLTEHFGAARVFKDLESISPGEDFVSTIEKAVGSCAVFLVVIGRQWLELKDRDGGRRLDSPRDFVHMEIAAALRRGVTIIPVLVEGATMPGEDALPPPLARLARLNAVELSDSRWQYDVEQLIEALEGETETAGA